VTTDMSQTVTERTVTKRYDQDVSSRLQLVFYLLSHCRAVCRL